MAKQTMIIDDTDGSAGAAERTFTIDGQAYEIDMTDDNWAAFLDRNQDVIRSARKVKSGRRATSTGKTGGAGKGLDITGLTEAEAADLAKRVREWARGEGHELSDKGRISNAIVEAWNNREQGSNVQEGEDQDEEEGEPTPLPPVTDGEIVQWARAQGLRVVAGKCTSNLRTRYRTDNADRVLDYDIKQGATAS